MLPQAHFAQDLSEPFGARFGEVAQQTPFQGFHARSLGQLGVIPPSKKLCSPLVLDHKISCKAQLIASTSWLQQPATMTIFLNGLGVPLNSPNASWGKNSARDRK